MTFYWPPFENIFTQFWPSFGCWQDDWAEGGQWRAAAPGSGVQECQAGATGGAHAGGGGATGGPHAGGGGAAGAGFGGAGGFGGTGADSGRAGSTKNTC